MLAMHVRCVWVAATAAKCGLMMMAICRLEMTACLKEVGPRCTCRARVIGGGQEREMLLHCQCNLLCARIVRHGEPVAHTPSC